MTAIAGTGPLVPLPGFVLLLAVCFAGWRIAVLIARALEDDDADTRAMREWHKAKDAMTHRTPPPPDQAGSHRPPGS